MKPFNLSEAKAGNPVCTRDGREARIVCFDMKDDTYPIVALILTGDEENQACFTKTGRYTADHTENEYDLFMKSEIKAGWVNLYEDQIYTFVVGADVYKTEEEAKKRDPKNIYKRVQIQWK